MQKGYILGISCGYHDSAASLIKDGTVLGACEEERFTGIKHDSTFPINTIKWLMETYNVKPDTLDVICFYENPKNKLDRIKVSTEKKPKKWYEIFNKKNNILIRNQEAYETLQTQLKNLCGKNTKIHYTDHHQSHLAYAYYTSNFKESAILSVDGVGEWETTVLGLGTNNKIKKLNSINFPHSLGMLYSTFTAFLGFKPNEGEYKVMGLAPYGDSSKYLNKFKQLYTTTKDGGFEFNMDYFTYEYSTTSMFNEKVSELFELPNRLPEDELTQKHKDIAAGLQQTYEFLFFRLLSRLYKQTKSENLCLSGGCAYNGTANGKILKRTEFKNLYIPPAPSDAGSAIGCALNYYYKSNNNTRVQNTNPYIGPSYNKSQILETLEKYKELIWIETKLYEQIIDIIADEIRDGNVIGWFQGRMEFGARALGNRSILANPRDPQMKSRLNKMIKKREGFRPFAPIVKEDSSLEYFDYHDKVPYMNQVVKVRSAHAKHLPAITHIDNSARIQTLSKHQHRYIYSLLEKLELVNKYPIVINTSFNLKDQTMVLTPEDAIKTFLNCEMDTLVLHNYIIRKKIL
jgi:carbamoyltransferase